MAEIQSEQRGRINSSLKILVKTSVVVLIGLFFSKLLTYIYRVMIARSFGPEVYGIYSLATLIVVLFVAVSSLGLTDGLLRYLAIYRAKKETKKIHYLLRFSLFSLIISGFLSGILLFFTAELISINIFHNSNLIIYLKAFSVLIPIIVLFNVFLYTLRAFEKISSYSFLQNIFQSASKVLILWLFIIFGFNADRAIILSIILGSLFSLIAAYILAARLIPSLFMKSRLKKGIRLEIRKSLMVYSWPLIFSAIVGNLFYWIDSLMLGYFKSATEVGFYNAAVPIAGLMLVSLEIFMQLFFPLITKEFSLNNSKVISELSKQVAKWIFIINLPALLIMLIFPGVLINLFFGKEYLVAETPLRILAAIMFFNSMTGIFNSLLSMIGKSKLLLVSIVASALLNLLLNILFIPKYGMNGAAWSSFIAMLFLGIFLSYWTYKYLKIIPLKRKMINIFLIAAVLFVLLLLIKKIILITPLNLIVIGVIFITAYLALIYLTKCFDDNDLMVINAIKKKIFGK